MFIVIHLLRVLEPLPYQQKEEASLIPSPLLFLQLHVNQTCYQRSNVLARDVTVLKQLTGLSYIPGNTTF
jgi:hypothetical protein